MGQVRLVLPRPIRDALWAHLLPERTGPEEAAFVYAICETGDGAQLLRYVEWQQVPPKGFASRSAFHFELADEMRAAVIKRAHDLGASLVEFHSHTGPWPPAFSPSDLAGLREFVPHVWWRLKGRPYVAVVVARSGFDGLAWLRGPTAPEPLDGILVGESVLTPTGLSRWEVRSDD